MSDGTHIQWTDATWNIVTGCTKISEGCDHCYIERTPPFRMQGRRFDKPGIGGTTGVKRYSDRLHLPLRWRKPRRIFVNSLSDLFHDEVPDVFIAEVFAVMALAPQHQFQVLTKRPARMRSLLSSADFRKAVQRAALVRAGDKAPWLVEPWWPLRQVWLGVSVENQKWAEVRISTLADTPAAVRWLSLEPLLGPVDLSPWLPRAFERQQGGYWLYGTDPHGADKRWASGQAISWVVVGGESGPGSRPMQPAWAQSLRDQCASAGVPFFFKQWGEWVPPSHMTEDVFMSWDVDNGTSSYDHDQPWRVGKKRAGRLLDGREWSEYPTVVGA